MPPLNHKTKLLVFLSHASEDKTVVRKLSKQLRSDGFDPWLDEERLLPGQNWELEIEQALRGCSAVLLCFSEKSISKEGFIQREYKRAVQFQEEKPDGMIYIIPVRLDKCKMPHFIQKLQWVDYPAKYDQIVLSLNKRKGNLKPLKSMKTTPKPSTKIRNSSPDAIFEIAKEEIAKKKNQMPVMRPGYDLGKEIELRIMENSKDGTRAIIQFYEYGMIVWHMNGKRAGKAFAVYGGIGNRYRNLLKGQWKSLGFPVSDENEASWSPFLNSRNEPIKGRYNEFENGEIVWYESVDNRDQVYVVTDPIRKLYASVGGTGSYLGFPIGEVYKIKNGQRCDFEGGTIVSLSSGTYIVRQLARINYTNSPFENGWKQYSGPIDPDCASVRLDTRLGYKMNMVAFNFPWESRAIRFPGEGFSAGELRHRYCGLTIKSLIPDNQIRFYIRVKTNKVDSQYLDYESGRTNHKYHYDNDDIVDYWQVPLPSGFDDGYWHTAVIDLHLTTQNGFTTSFDCLRDFRFRGHIGIADLLVSDSREAIEVVAINPIIVE